MMTEHSKKDSDLEDSLNEQGRLCGATREGSVVPLTTLDRQTGRAAPVRPAVLPAGSREEERRSPLEGGGGGRQRAARPVQAARNPGAVFSSYPRNNCPKGRRFKTSERRRWLGALEETTRPFRTKRSRAAHSKAMAALEEGNRFKCAWYQARARGQRRRFDTVQACGDNEIVIRCDDCGHSGRRATAFCDQWRLCLGCRSRRGTEYRKRFRSGRARALERLAFLMRRGANGGEWTEKFLTLTLPHSGDVVLDLKVLPKAWRWFWNLAQLQAARARADHPRAAEAARQAHARPRRARGVLRGDVGRVGRQRARAP